MLIRFYQSFRPHYEPDGGGGTGNGGTTPPATPPAGGDPAAAYQRLLERTNNDQAALSRQLYDENYRYREQLRELQGRLPAEGAVVLTREQAEQWTAYQGLGALADIQAGLTARDTATQELATLRQDLTLRDVAGLCGYDVDVLRTLGASLSYSIKDEQENGKSVKKVFIKDGDKETPIAQFEAANWQKFLPSLRVQPPRPAIGTPRAQTPPAAGQGQQQQEQPRKSTVRL